MHPLLSVDGIGEFLSLHLSNQHENHKAPSEQVGATFVWRFDSIRVTLWATISLNLYSFKLYLQLPVHEPSLRLTPASQLNSAQNVALQELATQTGDNYLDPA